jgi:osmotically inducible protein OsmC
MTTRKADATWSGSLREGAGEIALESGAFRGTYKTNPEELLGAAHAGCFTMALTAPGMTAEQFAALAADAKVNCPVSKALAGVEITLDAALE